MDGTRPPLSVAQHEIWLAEQLNPKGRHSRIGGYLEIRGPIDTERFEAALRRTIAEAEPFRVRFGESEGVPWQTPDVGDDWIFPVLDVSAEDDPMAAAKAWMRADLARRLPLSTGPLFSYALFRLGPEHFVWYLSAHHIVADGHSGALISWGQGPWLSDGPKCVGTPDIEARRGEAGQRRAGLGGHRESLTTTTPSPCHAQAPTPIHGMSSPPHGVQSGASRDTREGAPDSYLDKPQPRSPTPARARLAEGRAIGAHIQPEQADKETPRTCTSGCIRIRDVCSRATLDHNRHPECPDIPHGQQTETTIPIARIRPGFAREGLFSG
ncbi:condensation domain-containing protein [Streptomyces sp. NPDC091217]|uniref:condensation domain-containing protein n=1 Tax=Streptomyces sp. NPDC091217 TaxID=3365975 RepID=UPI0038181AA5